MSHIYWNKDEIPRPESSYINRSDGRVFIMKEDGRGVKKRMVIGRATSDTMMHANDLFKFLYPNLWEKYYGRDDLPIHYIHIGLYIAVLAIGYKTNLYPILLASYGPLYANAIMDYAMYSIMDRKDTTELFEETMDRQVLFSKKCYSDSWYSNFFENGMSEDMSYQFRFNWLGECIKRGTKNSWLSIDGSNNDCDVSKSNLAEAGEAKSKTDSRIVSFTWAVDTETGMPVTYKVNRGSMPDCKAFQDIAETLHKANVNVEGVICDRGFAVHDTFVTLKDCGYSYVIMLKTDSGGHTSMLKDYAREIRWNVRHIVNDDGLFGISDKRKVFTSHPEEAYINLYFDAENSTGRAMTLIRKIRKTRKEAEKANGSKPTIPKDLDTYLKVVRDDNSWKIECCYDDLQEAVDTKGYSSLASSEDYGPELVDHLYHLRDVVEKQYSIMKSQMGYDVTRVQTDNRIYSRYAICFVSSIIRNVMQQTCKKLKLDTDEIIRDLSNHIFLILMPDGTYSAVDNLSKRDSDFLHSLGIEFSDFKYFAEDVNRRLFNPMNSQVHRLPNDYAATVAKKVGRPPKAKQNEGPKRKPGRPKGSKNKATLEKEASEEAKEKRKPGRPKGSKNKKTLEKEQQATLTPTTQEKRKPGRPKGSKNKTPQEKAVLAQQKRKPGRPKGSKNKKTLEKEQQATSTPTTQKKRKPGRPKGSKNKTPQEKAALAQEKGKSNSRKSEQALS